MTEEHKQQTEIKEIDLAALFKKLITRRKSLYKAIGAGIIAGAIIGFSLPKTYQVNVSLSPESGINGTSGLSGIASMFGLGTASAGFGEDALTFNMFPEIVKTNPFALEMLQIPIQTQKETALYSLITWIRKKALVESYNGSSRNACRRDKITFSRRNRR